MQRAILVALGFAFSVTPVFAAQLAAVDAITPVSCEIETTSAPAAGDGADQQAVLSGVGLSFTNHGTAAIVDVTFAVTYDGQTTMLKDVGTFAPGVTIHHRFPLAQRALTRDDVGCRIANAHFSAVATTP
jgi:hypothetical protein